MTFLTRIGFHHAALLAVAGLLAGCQSSRTAFQFASAAPYASSSLPVTAPTASVPVAASAADLPQLAALPAPLRRAASHLAHRRVRVSSPGQAGTPAPGAPGAAALATLAAPVAPPSVAPAPRWHQTHLAPARTQESGLKRIFFFFLVVVLGVLAGLGALLSLIPGVSFFGGVGLAAAGLLVLFLLYSLLSGGKKKAKVK